MKKTISKNLQTSSRLFLVIGLIAQLVSSAYAEPNYHLIGWTNTFVPGSGKFLLGEPLAGSIQAVGEVVPFTIGYAHSKRSPFTLDGVPEDVPPPTTSSYRQSRSQFCSKHANNPICSKGSPSDIIKIDATSLQPISIQRSLIADILQEFGLKYHMVNTFDVYRQAAKAQGVTERIDQTPTKELFLSPFRSANLGKKEVYIPLAVSAAAIIGTYYSAVKSGAIAPVQKLTRGSNRLYAATYTTVFPVGSGAPEEMFYRGFLQNEAYNLTGTPWASIPIETLAYTLSHSDPDKPSAAITGIFLGILTHAHKGSLSEGIAYHFWADVMTGVFAVALIQKSEFYPRSTNFFNFNFHF